MESDLSFPLKATFIALPLEGEAKWHFQALQEKLQPFQDSLRFQSPQTPHLTLQYWKEVMEIEFHQIVKQAEKIAAKAAPFMMRVTDVGLFQVRGQARVLFLTITFSEELARLKKDCPWPSDKPFAPHITLARVSHPGRFAVAKKKILKLLEHCSFDVPVDRLRLYAEIGGKQQTPIRDFVLES